MASTLNAIKNITGDSWWIVKLGIFTAAYFFLRNQSHIWRPVLNEQSVQTFEIILFLVLFGCAVVSVSRDINNKVPFIPGLLDIPEIILKTILGAIAIAPGVLISYMLYVYISKTFNFEELFVTVTVYAIAAIIMSAFIFIPLVLFCARGNIIDAFNIKTILTCAGNYIVQVLGFVIAYGLIMGAITISLYYFLLEMLGDHPILLVLQCLVIILTFYTFFSFCADMYQDVIPPIKTETKSKNIKKHHVKKSNLKR